MAKKMEESRENVASISSNMKYFSKLSTKDLKAILKRKEWFPSYQMKPALSVLLKSKMK